MKNSVLAVLIAASAALLLIVGLIGGAAVRQANRIHEDSTAINTAFRKAERQLDRVRADIDSARIHIRDYMLDPGWESAELKKAQFDELKTSIDAQLDELSKFLESEEASAIEPLRSEINGYFETLSPILEAGYSNFSRDTTIMRRNMASRRDLAASALQHVAEINERIYTSKNSQAEEARKSLSIYLTSLTATGLLLGIGIAVVAGYNVAILQRQALLHQQKMAHTEAELRRLSGELVRAHENERKSISRELHDEVGQTLTALGIEIGNIDKLVSESSPEFREHIADARRLTQLTLNSVRDLAMGLRPSMLDDSGLVPALRWQTREFSKRVGVPVKLEIEGSLITLPEKVSTCVYRVVQEALTNCARHASAQNIRIRLHGDDDRISLAIEDDGVGFDSSSSQPGIGILGIGERVREMNGELKITSRIKGGTRLLAEIPLKATLS